MCYIAIWKLKVHKFKRLGEVQGADHHDGGSQRVAGALEVVPLDTVQLANVLPLGEVHAVKVGRATRIKPPT